MAGTPTEQPIDAAGRSIAHSAEAQKIEQPSKGGLPQFEFEYWGGQILWLVVIFATLYLLLDRVFAPRLRGVLDLRAKTIAEAIASARSVQSEAAEQAEAARKALEDARATALKTAADAKAKAQAEAKARQAELEAELAEKLDAAEAGIRASRDAAMSNVSAVASETAQAIVEKLTGIAVPDEALTSAMAAVGSRG